MWNRVDLKRAGKAAFKMNYWKCVLASIIMAFVAAGGNKTTINTKNLNTASASLKQMIEANEISLGWVLGIFLAVLGFGLVVSIVITAFAKNPLRVGWAKFYVKNSEGVCDLGNILSGFNSGHYVNVIKTMFMKDIFVVLWTLLFVIPGIIASYSYRMVPYILSEDQEIEWSDALRKSKEMMDGNKWDVFILDLSFMGWLILSVFTLGLLNTFYVAPYMDATNAELYKALKSGGKAEDVTPHSDLSEDILSDNEESAKTITY